MKKVISLLLTIVCVLVFAACKNTGGSSSADMTASSKTQSKSESAQTGTDSDIVETSSENTSSIVNDETLGNSGDLSSETEKDETKHNHTFSAATCEEPAKCSCGATKGKALNHEYVEKTTPATCDTYGEYKKVCKHCGIGETTKLNPKEHTFTETIVKFDSSKHKIARSCSVCGYKVDEMVAHTWGEWSVIKASTKETQGEQKRSCTVCGESQIEKLPKIPYTQSELVTKVFELVNVEREKNGLDPLQYLYDYQSAADVRAEEIQTVFSHTRPDGSSCFTALDQVGAEYRSAGENIAKGQITPEEVVQDWMNSQGHRENILNKTFTHIIVGHNNNAWVQLFVGL